MRHECLFWVHFLYVKARPHYEGVCEWVGWGLVKGFGIPSEKVGLVTNVDIFWSGATLVMRKDQHIRAVV